MGRLEWVEGFGEEVEIARPLGGSTQENTTLVSCSTGWQPVKASLSLKTTPFFTLISIMGNAVSAYNSPHLLAFGVIFG